MEARIVEQLKGKAEVICLDIAKKDVRPCLACDACKRQHTPNCIQKDDFTALIPEIDNSSASKSQPANRQLFFDMLPHDFNRSTYLAIAAQLNIPPKTAEKQIARLCEKGLLKHLAQGKYCKPQ